ncbi:bifunctional dethiobiotin synthetase/adenosylmethionine-8-amino-7-oxononanoate aminotransferase [Lindgomyces ingoldianus]|uniref:Bifunctional dethiobiotin synthetase/adenosylmethionine-8-amino-7-oxononanoate aminotransferase n=1 Tax=Lindgomyces ingoldianus TaxID=673940 RepID=A0ACB6R450_9PLEO|nr:bifunctional dethiobiotin synthetase/adenosylmethionine-8-amino-7-oxononanoate aminotransferase [Lindgomyces ingoldianus]KAF2473837.1 bifunctional dethiobiotin synthetase/adenosylmethionine-8-amino-7-oxononanoate aminotransferase [Lindgomyces ingoldianus]
MSRVAAGLWQNLVAVQVYGANTGVGKTVVSTLIGRHFTGRSGRTRWSVHYIKPVQTGPNEDADDRYVARYAGHSTSTLVKFPDPVSPHLAARGAAEIVSALLLLEAHARSLSMGRGSMGVTIVETAGGVLSPGPSGTPQADLFRPLRLPVILVGDNRLGGIASTISAYESLLIRGYDVDAIACFDSGKLGNSEYLEKHFKDMGIPLFELPLIPDVDGCSRQEEVGKMMSYYETESRNGTMYKLGKQILDCHIERLKDMKELASWTKKAIWHPFTQHKSIQKADEVLVFDSAYGDWFQTKHTQKSMENVKEKAASPMLYPTFDGSASWWTQGLGHGNPRLSMAAAYAAGRYGHIMFAGATHKPAISLAKRLLERMENPRLTKVFFTDNGSTGIEVGIKMALRAACKRYGWDGSTEQVGVLGLKGSYHGDTLGAMEASEPSVYNKKVDWYRGRGYWFEYPEVKMRKGRWVVEPPAGMEEEFGPAQYFQDLNEIFDYEARGHSARYEDYIERVLDALVRTQGKKFGALVMEPVLLGAGGMIFVDPLFQQSLVRVARRYQFGSTPSPVEDEQSWTGLPVVFDEVFTGLYRLGRFSAASFLQVDPDISVHAKLLTGGLLPLCTTLASNSIFEAFWGDEKSDALLHGHSYTAHPIGCHVANTSLDEMRVISRGYTWNNYRESWAGKKEKEQGELVQFVGKVMQRKKVLAWSMWSQDFVEKISNHNRVDSVVALGSVLAISLVDSSKSGYSSNAAAGLRDSMLNDLTDDKFAVHSRVLGNVLYLMASMTSRRNHLGTVERVLWAKLG